MSEFFIQDRQLSSITRTIVKDEKGKSLFLMVGRWGTKGDALSLYRLDGTLVASIKQISFTFGTRFEIYKDFEKVGTLQKIFNWPGDFYYIQQLHWAVQGDIYKTIMEMVKATLMTGDYYVIDVGNDEDAPVCICIAAIMDYWLYNRKRKTQQHLELRLTNETS